ncbi:nitrilase-related carbon-nitrogen hydrolase [Nocardia sp. NPDC058658]|uniref:nitrilase-related carbon-nitrogen hydrolase n=1 Tax=Nocardia sp. NPDC058658 TaxID=3346580 RepID=UPI00364A57E8
MSNRVRVGAVQAEPKWLNRIAGVEQVIGYIETAGDRGVDLLAFPETFLPGFPWWMWLKSVDWGEEFASRYLANSLAADGLELQAIASAANRKGVTVSLGFAERAEREVFMSQALIEPDGTITIVRKGDPTGLERTVFARSAGGTLVRDTLCGRVGVLGGSDHWRSEISARTRSAGEQIHIAAWSGFAHCEGDELFGPELNTSTCVRYAMDAAAYVVAPVAVVPVTGWEVVDSRIPDRRLLRGGGGVSRILGPNGLEMAAPLAEGTEGLLVADLDLSRTSRLTQLRRVGSTLHAEPSNSRSARAV